MLGHGKLAHRLLKTIEPVRKAAGQVRDMDVLFANALTLSDPRNDSVARLLEHLAGMRMASARELVDTAAEQRKDACRSLKHFSKQIGKIFKGMTSSVKAESGDKWHKEDAALKLITGLNGWPELNAENLHSFRIRLKELIYVLQLVRNADPKFVDALSKVKDQIGDWHDWQQLARIAEETLITQDDHAVLKKIKKIGLKKFNRSLAAANALRTRYLSGYLKTGIRQGSSALSHPQ